MSGNGYQARVFQLAVEIAARAVLPQGATLAGVAEKLAAMTGSNGHGRGDYGLEEWARDFLDCLPADGEAVRLILLAYVPGYVCACGVLHFDAGRCDDCGQWPAAYRWLPDEARRVGGLTRAFWGRVQARRLFARGLRLVERMG